MKTSDDDRIEAAVRWRVYDKTVRETRAKNPDVSLEEIEAAIDEAVAAVRAERFGSQR